MSNVNYSNNEIIILVGGGGGKGQAEHNFITLIRRKSLRLITF